MLVAGLEMGTKVFRLASRGRERTDQAEGMIIGGPRWPVFERAGMIPRVGLKRVR